jgi:hypothetical protein
MPSGDAGFAYNWFIGSDPIPVASLFLENKNISRLLAERFSYRGL